MRMLADVARGTTTPDDSYFTYVLRSRKKLYVWALSNTRRLVLVRVYLYVPPPYLLCPYPISMVK